MNTAPAKCVPEVVTWGSFALVSYLPNPLGSFLTQLRHLFPGDNTAEAHITFLPPRPLFLPLNGASELITRKLHCTKPFELELGEVQLFPQTNMLYLTVESGYSDMISLHGSLNDGLLSADEPFEYIPHLTLGGPIAEEDIESTLRLASRTWRESKLCRQFLVSELVLLWQAGPCSEKDWNRVSAFRLTNQAQNGDHATARILKPL